MSSPADKTDYDVSHAPPEDAETPTDAGSPPVETVQADPHRIRRQADELAYATWHIGQATLPAAERGQPGADVPDEPVGYCCLSPVDCPLSEDGDDPLVTGLNGPLDPARREAANFVIESARAHATETGCRTVALFIDETGAHRAALFGPAEVSKFAPRTPVSVDSTTLDQWVAANATGNGSETPTLSAAIEPATTSTDAHDEPDATDDTDNGTEVRTPAPPTLSFAETTPAIVTAPPAPPVDAQALTGGVPAIRPRPPVDAADQPGGEPAIRHRSETDDDGLRFYVPTPREDIEWYSETQRRRAAISEFLRSYYPHDETGVKTRDIAAALGENPYGISADLREFQQVGVPATEPLRDGSRDEDLAARSTRTQPLITADRPAVRAAEESPPLAVYRTGGEGSVAGTWHVQPAPAALPTPIIAADGDLVYTGTETGALAYALYRRDYQQKGALTGTRDELASYISNVTGKDIDGETVQSLLLEFVPYGLLERYITNEEVNGEVVWTIKPCSFNATRYDDDGTQVADEDYLDPRVDVVGEDAWDHKATLAETRPERLADIIEYADEQVDHRGGIAHLHVAEIASGTPLPAKTIKERMKMLAADNSSGATETRTDYSGEWHEDIEVDPLLAEYGLGLTVQSETSENTYTFRRLDPRSEAEKRADEQEQDLDGDPATDGGREGGVYPAGDDRTEAFREAALEAYGLKCDPETFVTALVNGDANNLVALSEAVAVGKTMRGRPDEGDLNALITDLGTGIKTGWKRGRALDIETVADRLTAVGAGLSSRRSSSARRTGGTGV